MTDAAPRRRLLPAIALGGAATIAIALSLAWNQRVPIAERTIRQVLADRGVPARYRIVRFGVASQTLADVSIGDPARPDLTARRATVTLAYRLGYPRVARIEAEGVRLRGRLVDGRVSLGAIDRLLPAPSGAPFALPDLDVALADTAIDLATPAGRLAIALTGDGNLAGGFRGRTVLSAPSLAAGGCRVAGAGGELAVTVTGGAPRLAGPLSAAGLGCNGIAADAPQGVIDVRLAPALDGWRGQADVAAGRTAGGGGAARSIAARLLFAGNAQATAGTVRAQARGARAGGVAMAGLAAGGRFTAGRGGSGFAGQVAAAGLAAPPGLFGAVRTGGGTPAGPALQALADRLDAAGRALRAVATVRADAAALSIAAVRIDAASGARARVSSPGGTVFRRAWAGGGPVIDAGIAIEGGGLPRTAAVVRSAANGVTGAEVRMAPIEGGGARIALAPITIRHERGTTRLATALTVDGPLGDGRIEGMSVPVRAVIAGGGYAVNGACVPFTFRRLAIAGSVIGASRLRLCPAGRAMLVPGGGGARLADVRLRGTVGRQPLALAAARIGVALDRPGFVVDGLGVRLGEGADPTRLAVARLAGRFDAGGVGGGFAGAEGKIGNVPLLIGRGAGDWRLAGARLALTGAVGVADSAATPRFQPMDGRAVRLTLYRGRIDAAGTLHEPVSSRPVADVTIRHDLADGTGAARLAVPGLAFDPALQPEALTRTTLGIVANVRGTITGEGRIRWGADGVSSDGDFETDGIDLAAAFGPVKGIAGRIHFSDLLALETPPGQTLAIAEANPGIAVEGGTVAYQLRAGQQVAVEGGRWPFMGGTLTLDPTLMDFGRPVERRMTFHVAGMDAGEFIQAFDLKNISVTGTFDGSLPMVFDERGGRIDGGRLAVRRGGGTLAYVGEISNAALGTFGRLAFDALKSMRYRSLAIELDGRLDGELVSRVLFDGTNEAPVGARQAHGLLAPLIGLPFRFRITIRAPFRGLLNSASSLNDPRGLIRQALPARVDLPGSGPVQPSDSKDRR